MTTTLDRAYRVEESGGVARYRAVVFGQTDGGCRYPGAAGRGGVLGVTTHSQPNADRAVAVRRAGIALAEAASAIAKGDPVVVADSTGRIASAPRASVSIGSAPADNAIDIVVRIPGLVGNLLRIVLDDSESDVPLGFAFVGGLLTVTLATDSGGSVLTTAQQLVDAINADANLSSFLVASNGTGSDGTGLLASAGEASFAGGEGGDNIVGFAQEAATAPGDIVEVLVAP